MELPPSVDAFTQRYLAPYWTETNLFWSVILFSWVLYLFELYLNIRQFRVYKNTDRVPGQLAGVIDHDTFVKAKNYNVDRARFSFITGFWSQSTGTLTLYYFILPYLWTFSATTMHNYLGFKRNHSNEIVQSILFTFITTVLSTLLNLPFSIYSNFVIEERHGFNKQTPAFYAKDTIKKFVVNFAISTPIVATIVYIVRTGGQHFFIYLWLFCFVVLLVLTAFHGEIAALFDKFTPLPEGELRDKIMKLAEGLKFPLTQMYVVEGSARSSHSNAYFFGFFNRKRIVLYDTLIEGYEKEVEAENRGAQDEALAEEKKGEKGETKGETTKAKDEAGNKKKSQGCNHEEILAVLGHELGHWSLNHMLKNIVFAEVNLFFMFLIFNLLHQNETLFSAFGFQHEKPVLIGLFLVINYVLAPYNEIYSFINICLSRRYEFQADFFAKKLGRSAELKSALIKMNKDNLGFPVYDELYSKFTHSHPPLLERIEALDLKND